MKKIVALLCIFIALHIARAQNEIVIDPNASERTMNGDFIAIKFGSIK
jgi:hypothetical protein